MRMSPLELTQRLVLLIAADMRGWLDMGLPLRRVGIDLATAAFMPAICTSGYNVRI